MGIQFDRSRVMKKISFRSIKDTGPSASALRLVLSGSASAVLVALAALLLSKQPGTAMKAFFITPFASATAFLSMLELAAPLALCALGVVISFRAGHFSLGGEGQAYAGSFAAALFALFMPGASGFFAVVMAFALGALAGALVAAIPAAGSRFAGTEVLLSSLLVSQGFIYLIDWAISGPLRDSSRNLIAMPPVPEAMLLPRLAPPSTLSPAPFLALAMCFLASFYFERTRTGSAHDLYGRNSRFAKLQGYNTRLFSWLPIVASGAFHGLAGAVMVLGLRGSAIRGMSGGIGWSAIGVSLIASSKPSALFAAAFLFAWLDAGARQASILAELPADSGMAIKAMVILVIGIRPALMKLKRRHL